GSEASWAGGGILSPLYPWRYPEAVDPLARWSQAHYPKLVETLKRETGLDPEWTHSGLLILDAEDCREGLGWCEAHGIPVELLDPNDVSDLEPSLQAGPRPGLRLPGVAQVRNPRLLKALVRHLRSLGVEFREGVAVTGFEFSSMGLSGLHIATGTLPAERCLVAAGPWSASLLATVGLDLPLRPVRGQMLLLRGGVAPFSHILLREGRYLIPRRDGRILVGSTQEETGFDKSTTPAARALLLAAATALVPELGDWQIEQHWAGLRPGSPDGVPYIGEHPEIAGLYVNTGHFRNGIVLAPASARLIVDMMLARPLFLDPGQFSLIRTC
ncbi:MAG: NAD(P)/FAD-dependent oxidoreductase, partial [Acidobacteriaceae bacterium]